MSEPRYPAQVALNPSSFSLRQAAATCHMAYPLPPEDSTIGELHGGGGPPHCNEATAAPCFVLLLSGSPDVCSAFVLQHVQAGVPIRDVDQAVGCDQDIGG